MKFFRIILALAFALPLFAQKEGLQRTVGTNTVTGSLTSAPFQVATIAALKAIAVSATATAVPNGTQCYVTGYYTNGDGGQGIFTYNSGSAATDNGGTVIQPTTGTGRWIRIQYSQLNVLFFGAKKDGVTDDTTAIQASINAAAVYGPLEVIIPPGNYATSSTITVSSGVNISGAGSGSIITYSGSGSALLLSGNNFTSLKNFLINTTATGANGIEAGNACRQCEFSNLGISGDPSASNTGIGLYLNAGTGFSGGLNLKNIYVTGYKYGVKMVGTNLSTGTWTTVDAVGVWLAGRSAGVIAGSSGIYMDALTNGVGTVFRGGTIESYDVAINHLNGGSGGSFFCDLEGNNSNYSVSATFNGEIIGAAGETYYSQWTNGPALIWSKAKMQGGDSPIAENIYPQYWVTYEGSSDFRSIKYYRGASLIGGGTPELKCEIAMGEGSGESNPKNNYIKFGGNGGRKMAWSTVAPADGNWSVGDIVFNSVPSVGAPKGWVCTVAGTPGTWVSQGNL